jgi:hypothetical protein
MFVVLPVRGALWVVGLSHALLDLGLSPGWPSRVPLPVRPSVPRRELACEPPHLRSTPEPHRSPWPILSAFSLGFVHTSQPREPEGVPVAPPSTCPLSVHSRDDGPSSLRLRGCHPRSPVPSSWFLTTSTASSALRVAGLLHPAADPGVHRVSACSCPRSEDRDTGGFPAMQVRTPRRSPRRQPVRVTASVASLPFAARSPPRLAWFPLPVADPSRWEDRERRLRGLAPSSSLVSPTAVAGGGRPAPSWASFLFKVLRCGRRSVSHRRGTARRSARVSPFGRRLVQLRFRTRWSAEAESRRRSVPKHFPAGTALDELVPGAFRGGRFEDRCRREDGTSRCSRSCTGEAPRDRGDGPKPSPVPDPMGDPFVGSIARGVHHTAALAPRRRGGRSEHPGEPGVVDAVEVCPELKSRGGALSGCPELDRNPRRPS